MENEDTKNLPQTEQITQNYLIDPENLPQTEQITQNYLIDPENLKTNIETNNSSFIDMSLPKTDMISSYELDDDNFLQVSKTKTPDNIFKIEDNSNQIKNSKEFKSLVNELNFSVKPSVDQLYSIVSQVLNKTQDPKGFTENRPTFNGIAFFLDEEKIRISEKPPWA